MKMYLCALKGPNGLYSFAITPASDAFDIVNSIVNSLKDLYDIIDVSNRDEVIAYCDLLLDSSLVRVLDFDLLSTEVNVYHEILSLIIDNDVIIKLINDIKSKEVL